MKNERGELVTMELALVGAQLGFLIA